MSFTNLIIALSMAANTIGNGTPQNKVNDQISSFSHPESRASNDDIVVIGNKLEKYKQITKLAEAITNDLDFNNPLARYTSSICLEINGLDHQLNDQIKISILNSLDLIKIPHKEQNCRVNAAVFFVDNPNSIVKSIYKNSPMLFGALEYHDINKKLKENGDSISIQNIVMRGVDGDKIVGKAVPVRSSSIIDLPIRRDIESSVVVVDRNSIIGYTISQISGFLTFRILANVRVPSSISGNSILEMFNLKPSACPKQMTGWDISYLKEVYSGSGNLRGVRKIGQITRRMLREDK